MGVGSGALTVQRGNWESMHQPEPDLRDVDIKFSALTSRNQLPASLTGSPASRGTGWSSLKVGLKKRQRTAIRVFLHQAGVARQMKEELSGWGALLRGRGAEEPGGGLVWPGHSIPRSRGSSEYCPVHCILLYRANGG